MASPATNTITRALLVGEDKARKEKMITWLKSRNMLDASTEKYLRSGRR